MPCVGNGFFFWLWVGFCKWPSRDISDLNETPPGPTRGIIVGMKVHEAREMEPVFGGWDVGFVASRGM